MEELKETKLAEIERNEPITKDALDIIEKRDMLFKRVMAVAIAATNPSDWIDQDGKPYLQGSGAEKVARRFGVRIYDVVIERENLDDEKGEYYLYTVMGKAALGGGNESIESIGTCSSRDKLFSHGGRKAMQDVDIGNIKKKAYTNFMGNAITRLLGIRNMTWDDLAKFGICRNGKASISYQSASIKADATKQSQQAENQSKKPYWTSPFKGVDYVHARSGNHFSEEFLLNLGFKASKEAGKYHTKATTDIINALDDEYVAAEEQLAIMEEGVQNDTITS